MRCLHILSKMDLHGLICQMSRFLHEPGNNLHTIWAGHRAFSTNVFGAEHAPSSPPNHFFAWSRLFTVITLRRPCEWIEKHEGSLPVTRSSTKHCWQHLMFFWLHEESIEVCKNFHKWVSSNCLKWTEFLRWVSPHLSLSLIWRIFTQGNQGHPSRVKVEGNANKSRWRQESSVCTCILSHVNALFFLLMFQNEPRGCVFILKFWQSDANAITKAGVRYRLSVIRVLDVGDINKAETCNWHCGMIGFATWSRKSRPSLAWKVNRRAIQRCASSSRKQMKITIKYSNATLFIFATLTIGTYDTMNPVDETMKLERKEGWHFL